MHKKHFFLGNNIAEDYDFSPWNTPFKGEQLPQRDRTAHATLVRECYKAAIAHAIACQEERNKQGFPMANGVYVDIEMDKKFIPVSLGKQDGHGGATIMKVTDKGNESSVDVTVFVKKDKKNWLDKKVDDYEKKNTPKGIPCNEKIIAPINNIVATDIRTLYVSAAEFDAIPEDGFYRYELWLSHSKENTDETIETTLLQLGIEKLTEPLRFDGVNVWLIGASKQQLCSLPFSLGYIESIRPYKEPSILIGTNTENREWSELIKNQITFCDDAENVIVGILDSGVNNAHELLNFSLPDKRMDVAIGVQDAIDKTNHGTGMAGLALLGDLTDIAYQRNMSVDVHHSLSSIKIYEEGYETLKEFYGAVIEEAVDKASNMGASIQCMAITDESSYNGIATSSSAALDESIYHQGLCDRLVLVSAGNVEISGVDSNNYIESCKAYTVKSPAQAWNALTVGAYTEKATINNPAYRPLAALGGISPYSCSSFPWKEKRNKPDIVMEGGNVAFHNIYKETSHPDLSLVTTSNNLQEPLESFCATSGATGLAARLAARIKVENPQLSMLSIRGLMIHSAQWTDEMKRINSIEERMSLCGYGVPDEDIALFSNEKCATYIFENHLKPYTEGDNCNIYGQMHYYDLPWPKELLEEMGSEDVRIRITLSYYVKPSPGYTGRTNKYRYPSATLRFDLKTATETQEEFLCRRNKYEGEKTTDNEPDRWNVKQQRRERGTVQSDWIKCTAADLAEMDKIVVFPGPGWWKNRKLTNVDNVVSYSLIVAIETKETDIYNAVEAAIENRIGIQIAQGT
ncbi:S8 family peptidase [Prevotella scopos JCM 17725]|uniref:Subtilase family protein n=1 Tax=Prevotella scopos JCM 17725 TaxID=1236518 RepID=A0AAX2F357_9BACT|nr:S8 family peptidase [Prevotella scopos]ANR72254.1 peptidase S8 [Prevotella scopos JCM 17725]QUB45540.1 S8 family peptidase [Prevotella scopos JCM 17725]SHF77576.1 Subtilase family protein [Prevotella scopos JCM 17725]